jgi:hypothetical protein
MALCFSRRLPGESVFACGTAVGHRLYSRCYAAMAGPMLHWSDATLLRLVRCYAGPRMRLVRCYGWSDATAGPMLRLDGGGDAVRDAAALPD